MYRVLYDFGRGQLMQVSEDEFALDAKHPDRLPADQKYDSVKFRLGVWHPKFGSTVISRDVLTGSPDEPRRSERGFFGLRHDDRFANNVMADEFIVNITSPGQEGDAAQKVRFAVTHDSVEMHGRRVSLDALTQQPPAFLLSPNGRVMLAVQDDGNLVLYVDGQPVKARFGLPSEMLW